jgi:membrane protease YdiL (CAAX protease family)
MSLRSKVALELAIIAVLTVIFLVLFPLRNPALDLGLAAFALGCIALSARYTKKVVWAAAQSPPFENRPKRCLTFAFWITAPGVLLFLAIGAYLGYRSGGWSGVADRVWNWRIVVAFGCYLPWALMQQTLFQFYLLGRLLALFPRTKPFIAIAFTSIAVGLVHLPDIWTALVTVAAGFIWSFMYYRYRLLLPLAVSHAALGSAFYYGLFGHDLAAEWRAILP